MYFFPSFLHDGAFEGDIYDGDWLGNADRMPALQWMVTNFSSLTNTVSHVCTEGQKHGQGVYSYAQSESFHGTFDRGKIVGKGTMTYSDRSAIEGQYVEVDDLPRITKSPLPPPLLPPLPPPPTAAATATTS